MSVKNLKWTKLGKKRRKTPVGVCQFHMNEVLENVANAISTLYLIEALDDADQKEEDI